MIQKTFSKFEKSEHRDSHKKNSHNKSAYMKESMNKSPRGKSLIFLTRDSKDSGIFLRFYKDSEDSEKIPKNLEIPKILV